MNSRYNAISKRFMAFISVAYYVVFIIFAQLLGSVVNLYNTTWWYDLFAHFISGVLTSILALVVIDWFGVYNEKKKGFNFLFIICFTLMVASIWEFLEYGAYVNVVFKTGVTRADCEKFNEAIFTIMEEDLKVPKENVYTTFQYCDDFGVQGKFL